MTAALRDNTSKTTTTMVAKTCARSAGWTPVGARVTPGHSYTMTIVVHADGQRNHPTYAFVDDAALGVAAPRQFLRSGVAMDGPR